MFQARYRVPDWLLKLPVIILYLAFFAVQIFFNLDIAQRTAGTQNAVLVKSKTGQSENIKNNKAQSAPKSKIRLNKRFQPSSIPDIFHSLVISPVIYGQLKPTALTRGNFYSFVFLTSQALRGPPVIA